jgi:hypothetical protein
MWLLGIKSNCLLSFFFNCWYLEIPSDIRIRYIPRCTVLRKAFDWKRSRISVESGSRTPELYSVSYVVERKERGKVTKGIEE